VGETDAPTAFPFPGRSDLDAAAEAHVPGPAHGYPVTDQGRSRWPATSPEVMLEARRA
jgi:hypothetical protein